MEKIATVTSKGQVVIPKSIRLLYSLETNTKIIFEPKGEKIILKPLKNNFLNLNKKLANFNVNKNNNKDWEKSLAEKLEQLKW